MFRDPKSPPKDKRRPPPPPAPPRKTFPCIAPPVAVVADQLEIAYRLHLIASSVPASYPVTVLARELLALLNGFHAESRRADQAEARLEALLSPVPPSAAASAN